MILIIGGAAVIAMFMPIGIAIGKIVLVHFGRIAIADRRDQER